jgi:hypothetical protein
MDKEGWSGDSIQVLHKYNFDPSTRWQDPKHGGNEIAIVGVYKWPTVWHDEHKSKCPTHEL